MVRYSLWTLISMEPVFSSPSPVYPLVDLLPLSLGPETLSQSLKEMRLLDNRTTSEYIHTLTVTGRLEGLYTCTVANNKPSKSKATFNIEGLFI